MYSEIFPEDSTLEFKVSNGWLNRFLSHHSLCCRSVTSQGQTMPSHAKDLAGNFLQYEHKVLTRKFEMKFVGNMDEAPLWFDLPSSRSHDFQGVKFIPTKTTGKEKLRYTVASSATADGSKLAPMVIFKGLKHAPKGKYPNDVIVQVNEKGYKTSELMNAWKPSVWKNDQQDFAHHL